MKWDTYNRKTISGPENRFPYEQLDSLYRQAEQYIPTRFRDYRERSREQYFFVKNNYYYLFELAEMIKKHIALEYGSLDEATIVQMLNSTDAVVKEYAKFLYDNDYRLYTAKQWGISPDEIDISVLQRVPVLFSYKTGYFDDSFQAMPEGGFTKFVQKNFKAS